MDKLLNFRKQINKLDGKLLQIIAQRMSVVKKIGKFKKKNNLPILVKKRRDEIVKSMLLRAKLLNLSESFVNKLFNLIHKHSLEIEKEE